jgi:hypothetical protein
VSIIYPCHWCDKPVYVNEALLFAHDACCDSKDCQEQHRAMRLRTLISLGVTEEQAQVLGI